VSDSGLEDPHPGSVTGFHHELGRKLKQERLRRGLTLKDIENRVGISATHLSEVERGKSSPTVGVLDKIARALGTRSSLLIEMASGPPFSHTRPGERRAVLTTDGTVRTESLSEAFPGAEVSLLLKTYSPAPARQLSPRGHEGEEFVYVLSGRLRVHVGEEQHLLEAGDSIHFKSIQPHAFENPGEEPCVTLLVTCPRYAF
jgi:transcriptional regulator with XRE-family HTH domain